MGEEIIRGVKEVAGGLKCKAGIVKGKCRKVTWE